MENVCWSSYHMWRYSSIMDNLMLVHKSRGQDYAADFLTILWEVWNSRNRFIFSSPDRSYNRLAQRAIAFIRDFREAKLSPRTSPNLQAEKWVPLPWDTWKLNFDAGHLGEWGRGLGFIVRDSLGDVVLARSNQSTEFQDPDVTEVEAYLFGIQQALSAAYSSLVMEGGALSVISKIRNKTKPSSSYAFSFQKSLKLVLIALMLLGVAANGVGIGWHMMPLTSNRISPAPGSGLRRS
ncbi:hypothetical protein Cgig2_020317 [Carnegiea gigantea]|uniref:RNase H type-1 domain-containing protein n=1 Tax=Carnegiea gigantea TaxID=171969 RepID=A0A9Q1Q7M3_9CARY|nr:hypothetical protein Cgig2_020317 [Carnegiea gigantea]